MPTIQSSLHQGFTAAIEQAFGQTVDPLISLSQNDKFGDYQSNAAMGLAKSLKANPRQVAEQIKTHLQLGELVSEITIAGPGFINVRLNPKWIETQLGKVIREGAGDAGLIEKTSEPQTVVVDYSGPNIAKELAVHHMRSTVIGDVCSRVIERLGHNVIRQNHLGDWGTQFGMLIANLQDKSGGGDAKLSDLEAFYVQAKLRFDAEPAFQQRARDNVVKLQSGDSDTLQLWRMLVAKTREHYLPLYRRLNVLLTPEHERGESFYNDQLAHVVRELKDKQIAVESDGATVVFVDGFKNPLIIEKTGGGYLYGTTDLAAVRYRAVQLKAHRVLYFVDARQGQHFAQVFAAAARAGWTSSVSLEHAAFGTMLGPDGKPFKTKTGGTVKLKDLLDEAEERSFQLVTQKNPELPEPQRRDIARAIGIGAVKYADLSKDRISDYVLSFDDMLALDGNTAPYLQYVYARICSIFRKANLSPESATAAIALDAAHELALAKHILRFGDVVQQVAADLKPHVLCAYLYDLATKFSGFYENCPVLSSDEPARSSRLALCALTARTMAAGLDLLGIEHPEQM